MTIRTHAVEVVCFLVLEDSDDFAVESVTVMAVHISAGNHFASVIWRSGGGVSFGDGEGEDEGDEGDECEEVHVEVCGYSLVGV